MALLPMKNDEISSLLCGVITRRLIGIVRDLLVDGMADAKRQPCQESFDKPQDALYDL